jgi:hypothetical protein
MSSRSDVKNRSARWTPTRWWQPALALVILLAPHPVVRAQEILEELAEPTPIVDGRSPTKGPKTLFRWLDQPVATDEDEGPGEIVTDRPDFTEASSTVGAGRFQIEAGFTYFKDRSDGVNSRSNSFPETLLRIGLFAESFEFRIAQNFLDEHVSQFENAAFASGFDDTYIGAKFWLTEQSGFLPEMVIMPQALLPTGDSDFNTNQVLPGLNWLYGWDVTDCIAIGGSTQGNRSYDGTEFFVLFAQSLTINYALTEKLGCYTESFCFMPEGANSPEIKPQYYFDSGFTYKVTINLQLDVRAGVGLNEAADDFFAGAGLAYRMGKNTRPLDNNPTVVRNVR